jgi:hypothetical protein
MQLNNSAHEYYSFNLILEILYVGLGGSLAF